MAIQLSPGINVSEVDATNATPAVGTTEGAIAGVFRWGPVNERILITSEEQLVNRFGKPSTRFTDAGNTTTWTNHETFYTAANFLGYSDALFVTRVVNATGSGTLAAISQVSSSGFKAKYYGELGNSISVSHCYVDSTADPAVNTYTPSSTLSGAGIRIDVTAGSTAVTFEGIQTNAQASSIGAGDKVVFTDAQSRKHELTLASALTITGSDGSGSAQTIALGAAPGESGGKLNDDGIVHQASTSTADVLAGSIIVMDDLTSTSDINLGDPIVFDALPGVAIPAGLDDNTTYFAIPVDDTIATKGQKVADSVATRAIKLATSFAKAIAHTDLSPQHVRITAIATDNGAVGTFTRFDKRTASATFTTRYPGSESQNDLEFTTQWGDANLFDAAPSDGHIHLVVRDNDGKITGTAGTILETYNNISTSSTAKKFDGTSNFITDVLFDNSNYIALSATDMAHVTTTVQVTSGTTMTSGNDGKDETTITLVDMARGYDLYKDPADVDVSLILGGSASVTNTHTLANYIIDNVLEVRRDAVGFFSPKLADNTVDEIVTFAGNISASTYAVVDSGYKYQYDKYSDAYRYVPLNGDVAGACARTDDLRDPWFSPAGYNRGNIKNVVKLLVNPDKAQRDLLYKNKVNPVITQPGQGTVLFGDKTFAPINSAFDRINVRRLFLVLEKTISQASKGLLFEFNDEFTRSQFVNLVEPFLRDVQGRRGIFDFKVVCDTTNNTSQVIDTNQFVGDIYVKPARSINFIQLNFVAVRSGVEFTEIVGQA